MCLAGKHERYDPAKGQAARTAGLRLCLMVSPDESSHVVSRVSELHRIYLQSHQHYYQIDWPRTPLLLTLFTKFSVLVNASNGLSSEVRGQLWDEPARWRRSAKVLEGHRAIHEVTLA